MEVGPKILNYIKNFMTNKKIFVKNGSYLSDSVPINNGVPQGSPLSVIVLLIAYNKLSKIIENQKDISFCSYADDFQLIINFNKKKNITKQLDSLFQNIQNWGDYSGSTLSLDNICNKHNCICTISSNNIIIPSVRYLKILGITINCKYKWNDHITDLITSLSKKHNIIKCLSNPKYQCDTLTLITIMKAIIISKIDFGIFLYDRAPKSLLKKLNTIINSSLRACFGAYRTSPKKNLMMEANIAPLQERYLFLKDKLFKSLHNSSDTPLAKFLTSSALKRRKATNSVLDSLIERCIELEIPIRPIKRMKETP